MSQTVKNLPARDLGLIPGLGRSPGEGKGYPLQYSDLENSTDRGDWQAAVHRVAKSQTHRVTFTFTLYTIESYLAIKRNAFESVLVR